MDRIFCLLLDLDVAAAAAFALGALRGLGRCWVGSGFSVAPEVQGLDGLLQCLCLCVSIEPVAHAPADGSMFWLTRKVFAGS
jgi:hypothetical protein